MNEKQIEVYRYYKHLYPESILLFHVGHSYVILSDDARQVDKILSNKPSSDLDIYTLSDSEMQAISKIGDHAAIQVIHYRNDIGEYDYPDIERLTREQVDDY